MPKQLDLAGEKFGRLTAQEKTEKRFYGSIIWLCSCTCGNTGIEVSTQDLQRNAVKSCGCLRHEMVRRKESNRIDTLKELTAIDCRTCSCGNTFPITIRTKNKKRCDKCLIKESVGKRPSKHDW